MISKPEREVLDKCLSECPLGSGLDRRYFSESDIVAKAPKGVDFEFNSFKKLLRPRTKTFCENCDEPFGPDHREKYRVERTVYTLDPESIAEEVIETASTAGPLEFLDSSFARDGIYRAVCRFGQREITFEFFQGKRDFLHSDIDPFDLEFPVLLRDVGVSKQMQHRFIWRELLSERLRERLSSVISDVRSKTTAVFAEYDEDFVSSHRTEIKRSMRDYFNRSGYTVHTEVADYCPELESYGIDSKPADYVCIRETDNHEVDEKILITHGSNRDGWYMQRFVDGELSSIEDEPIFENFHEQIDEKIRRYKRIKGQLDSAPLFMRGLGGVIAVVTTILAFLSTREVEQFAQSVAILSAYSSQLSLIVLLFSIGATGIFLYMLVSPYIKEKLFSWKMNSCHGKRIRFQILRHSKYFVS